MDKQHSSIYRQEAIDAQYMHKYSKVFMLPKVSHFGLFVGVLILMAMALVYISTQAFFETVNVKGWVNTTTTSVDVRSQEAAGVVSKVLVSNGSAVSIGEPIAIISRSHGEVLGKEKIAEKRQYILQAESNRLSIFQQSTINLETEAESLAKHLLQLEKQKDALSNHQIKHKQQLMLSKKRWGSVKALALQGALSILDVEQSELQMLALYQQDFDLFMQMQSLQTSQANIGEQVLKNSHQQAQLQHEMNLLNIQTQQELASLLSDTEFTVNAPRTGLIDNLQIDEGESVSFNQVLTQIAPPQPAYYIQLAIPSHQVAFLQEEQQVIITVDGFAYQKYGSLPGVIKHISEQVISSKDIDGLLVPAEQAVYLVDIDIDYIPPTSSIDDIALRSGMTVSASIYKQESTILEWLLAPLLKIARPKFNRVKAT
jgi:multidrug resistance efflux pump